jgi:UDP-glucose 4-epimerase
MSESYQVGVTGAAGYIGSRVAADLLDNGHDVIAVDNFYEPKVESIDGKPISAVDVRDRDEVRAAFSDVDVVMHLAAITGIEACEEDPEGAFDVNVAGTENVAWLCREWGTPLVFPASMAIVGDPVEFPISADHPRRPLNQYGLTKSMSEGDIEWLADGEFPALVFMKSNLYGHHDVDGVSVGKRTVINVFVERALSGEALTVHEPGTQSRDFVHVKDVSRAYELALNYLMDADDGCATVPIASGESRSVLEIADLVQGVVEEERGEEVPVELVENPRDVDETDAEDFDVDAALAGELLGFEAEYTLERGVCEMVIDGSS